MQKKFCEVLRLCGDKKVWLLPVISEVDLALTLII